MARSKKPVWRVGDRVAVVVARGEDAERYPTETWPGTVVAVHGKGGGVRFDVEVDGVAWWLQSVLRCVFPGRWRKRDLVALEEE